MRFKDYYDVLGVKPDASNDEIKSAYRKLARKFHPDVSKEKNAEDRFKDINEAFEALKDPERRAAFDQLRAGGYRPGDEVRPHGPFGAGGGGFEFDMGGDGGGQFSDFFESLFGRMRGGPRRSAGASMGEVRASIEIDLESAYRGGKQRISVQGARGVRTLEVKIPAGIQSGKTIRLAGQGNMGADGEPGDLLLEVKIRPHPVFALDGKDVTVTVALAPWEAALGAKVAVPTLAGEVELSIPAGSQSGRKMRLKGRGMPGKEAGDQFVVLQIQAPIPVTDADRAAYEALRTQFSGFKPRG